MVRNTKLMTYMTIIISFVIFGCVCLGLLTYRVHSELNLCRAEVEMLKSSYTKSMVSFDAMILELHQTRNDLRNVYAWNNDVVAIMDQLVSSSKVLLKHKDLAYATVTAYNSVPEQTDSTPWITATGDRVKYGIAAVSPDLEERGWKMYSIIYVDGLGFFQITDRTNPRLSTTVDIWMHNYNDALQLGKKKRKVFLLKS